MSDWIGVKDRPAKSGRYIVLTGDGHCFDAAYDECTEDECPFGEWIEQFDTETLGSIGSEWHPHEGITHWMPLPELSPQAGGGNMTYCNDKQMTCEYANIKGECSVTACYKELFIPGGQSVVKSRFMSPHTNADRIRAMSDEELANLLTDFSNNAGWTTEIGRQICYEQYQRWLQQPAEED